MDASITGKKPEDIKAALKGVRYFCCPRCSSYFCKSSRSMLRHLESECDWGGGIPDDGDEEEVEYSVAMNQMVKRWHRRVLKTRRYQHWFNEAGDSWEPLVTLVEQDLCEYAASQGVFITNAEVRLKCYNTVLYFYTVPEAIKHQMFRRYWSFVSSRLQML